MIDRAFVPVTVVPESEIRRNGGGTLGDQLNNLPGVTSSSFAPGGASRPIIRGLDNTRVRMQENGIGAQDVSDLSEDHAVPIDPLAAERIEVIRGPAALRFGSQAIGGVVNVTNERIPTRLGPPGISGMATALSPRSTMASTAPCACAAHGQWAYSADIFGRNAGDYATPQGRQANSFARTFGGSFGASYFFDQAISARPSRSSARSTAFRSRVGGQPHPHRHDPPASPRRARSASMARWSTTSASGSAGRSTATTSRRSMPASSRPPPPSATRRSRGASRPPSALATPLGTVNSVFGVQFGAARLGTSGEAGGLLAPANSRTVAAFLFNELELTRTTRLQASARIEQARVAGTGSAFPATFDPLGGLPVEFGVVRNFTP